MKNKYTDNKLAEEFDLIVLVNNEHKKTGLPEGSLGTLIASYTGQGRPLYADFERENGVHVEEPLALKDFRVLNEQSPFDLSLAASYFNKLRRIGG